MQVILTVDQERCKGCALCTTVCPKNLVTLSSSAINSKGYHPAAVEHAEDCIGCASCAKICPDSAIRIEKN